MKPGDYVVIKPNVTDILGSFRLAGLIGVVMGCGNPGDYDALVLIPAIGDDLLFHTIELRLATSVEVLAAKLQGLL